MLQGPDQPGWLNSRITFRDQPSFASNSTSASGRRLEQLLKNMQPDHSQEALRELRAVEALEHSPTTAARVLLESLAKGLPGAALTEEARQSLRR